MEGMTTLWRLAVANTHLYNGVRLYCVEAPGARRLQRGDRAVVEFSDGNVAMAQIDEASPSEAVLVVAAHSTMRNAPIAQKRWRLIPGRAVGELRIAGRAG